MDISKISVIIPCYNGERFIDRSIQSVYEQDWDNIELIVVDDGSTDESVIRIKKWQSGFTGNRNLKYVYQKNRGSGGAIDTALKHVTGDYLVLLDADDRFLPGALSHRASYLDEHSDVTIVRSNGWVVSGNDRWLFTQNENEKSSEKLFERLLLATAYNWAGSYMLRTNALFEIYRDRSIYSSRYGQNLQLLMAVAYKGKNVFIDEPLMEYIKQDESLSVVKNDKGRYEKAMANLDGYREIRMNILTQLNINNEYYMHLVDEGWCRSKLNLAEECGKIDDIKSIYMKMKENNYLSIDDKVRYFNTRNRLVSLYYRLLRKLCYVTETI